MCLVERIYLKSIGALINRKDIRSIRKWCNSHNLFIYRDFSGEFIYKNEFELANDKPLIQRLQERFKENWLMYYQAYSRNELYLMLENDFTSKIETRSYQPRGRLAVQIMNKSA
jgi:hypothetical protein